MRFNWIILCFLLSTQSAFAQRDITFNFLLKDFTLVNPLKTYLFDSLIITKRKIISRNEFIDFGVLCSDFSNDCSIKYKVDDKQNWFVFFEKRWKMLYDASDHKLREVSFKSGEESIIPVLNKEIANGKYSLLCYRIFNRKWHEPDNNNLYWFHSNLGLVVIESGSSFYVREDFSMMISKGNH